MGSCRIAEKFVIYLHVWWIGFDVGWVSTVYDDEVENVYNLFHIKHK